MSTLTSGTLTSYDRQPRDGKMPFIVRKRGDQWCCYTQGADGEPKGDPHGCFDSEEKAKAQQRALYANVPEARDGKSADFLAFWGGEVKALGNGRVGGYLVRFGTKEQTDTSSFRDYFTPQTDFATDFPAKTAVYYNHGLDSTLGRRRLADGAEMKADAVGVWVEAQLKMRDEWERAVYGLAEAGKLSWSSGTAYHLVERAAVKQGGETVAHEILAWPLGLDASLTPTPAEPRCAAVALKSLDTPELSALVPEAPSDCCPDCGTSRSLAEATEATIEAVKALAADYSRLALKEGRALSASRRDRLGRLVTELQALLAETEPRPRDADALTTAPVMGAPEASPVEDEPAADLDPGVPDLDALYARLVRQESVSAGWPLGA